MGAVIHLFPPPEPDPRETRAGRKACRKRVKGELKEIKGRTATRDALRRDFIKARCRACGRC